MISINIINITIALLCFGAFFKPIIILYIIPSIFIYVNLPGMTSDINALKLSEVGSVSIYATDLIICGMISYIIFCLIYKTNKFIKVVSTPISIAILVVIIWDIIIGIIYYYYGIPLENILRNFSGKLLMLLPILLPLIDRIGKKKENLIRYIFIISIIMVAIGIWRFLVGEIEFTSSGTPRSLHGYDVFIFLFGILYIVLYKQIVLNSKSIAYIALFLLLIGIHLAGHRSGYIVFFLAIASSDMIVKSPIAKLSALLITSSLFIAVSMGFIFSTTSAGDNVLNDFLLRFKDTYNIENTTTQARLELWTDGIQISKKSPIIGRIKIPKHRAEMISPEENIRDAPHNIFVDKIINEGYLGFFVLIGLLITIFIQTHQLKNYNNAYIAFLKYFFILCIFFSFFNQTYTRRIPRGLFFLVIGLINLEYIRFNKMIEMKRERS